MSWLATRALAAWKRNATTGDLEYRGSLSEGWKEWEREVSKDVLVSAMHRATVDTGIRPTILGMRDGLRIRVCHRCFTDVPIDSWHSHVCCRNVTHSERLQPKGTKALVEHWERGGGPCRAAGDWWNLGADPSGEIDVSALRGKTMMLCGLACHRRSLQDARRKVLARAFLGASTLVNGAGSYCTRQGRSGMFACASPSIVSVAGLGGVTVVLREGPMSGRWTMVVQWMARTRVQASVLPTVMPA